MSIPASDPQTFGWIKPALSQAMLQAMESINEVEERSDLGQLQRVSENLHQICGALQIVELDAASLFAEDLEDMTDQLSADADEPGIEEAVEILKNGLKSLKGYLKGIEDQTPQSPLVLLDNINAVRGFTEKDLISHYDLFNPPLELSSAAGQSPRVDFSVEKRRTALFHLRERFRQALCSWLNNENSDYSLSVMSDLIMQLQRAGGSDVLNQLWWVASGFVESIKNGDIEINSEVKAQFAQLDSEIGRTCDDNRVIIASSPPDELLRKMLFYIGKFASGETPGGDDNNALTSQIRNKLKLDQWFDFDAPSLKGNEHLELIETVNEFIAEVGLDRISDIENQLDRYFSNRLDARELRALDEELEAIGAVSDRYGISEISALLSSVRNVLNAVGADLTKNLAAGADLKIASAVLSIRSTLEDPSIISDNWKDSMSERIRELDAIAGQDDEFSIDRAASDQQAGPEYLKARAAVADEITNQLRTLEGFLSEYDFSGAEESGAGSAVDTLGRIASWLGVLNADRLMSLTQNTADALSALVHHDVRDTEKQKEHLAFAVAAIGICVETLADGGEQPTDIMRRAQDALDNIFSAYPPESIDDQKDGDDEKDTELPGVKEEFAAEDQIGDDELKAVFIQETRNHVASLSENIAAFKGIVDADNTGGPEIEKLRQEMIRTAHTLVGNFDNMGLRFWSGLKSFGGMLHDIQSVLILKSGSVEIYREYLDACGNLVDLLTEAADQVENKNKISAEVFLKLNDIYLKLRSLQRDAVGNAAPSDRSVVEVYDEKSSGFDLFMSDGDDETEAAADIEEENLSEAGGAIAIDDHEIDDQLKQIFKEEVGSLLTRINDLLTEWRANGRTSEIIAGLRREFHTLKGSAAATGHDDISRLSHLIESFIEQNDDADDDGGQLNLLEEMHDGLAAELGFIPGGDRGHISSLTGMVELLLVEDQAGREPAIADSIESELEKISDLLSETSDAQTPPDETSDAMARPETSDTGISSDRKPPVAGTDTQPQQSSETAIGSPISSSAIENRKLSELLNFSGELGLTRIQLKNTLDSTRDELNTLRTSMKKIRNGLRDLEFEADSRMRLMPREQDVDNEDFDPLQLDRYSSLQVQAREVNQQLDILTKVERRLSDRASDLGGTLIQQLHLGGQLQDGLINARMVSINNYVPRLRQRVRESSRRAEKQVALRVEGVHIEVDRQVMDTMMPPFEHMIINSIFHGIESSADRKNKGKPKIGRISLNFVQQGSELLIQFQDDGIGFDKTRIAARARELGIEVTDKNIGDDVLLQIISEPGYSTAKKVTMDSGRGVGMDVVHQAVRSLGGSVTAASEDGRGAAFRFRLPVTMAISQALLVRVGSHRFAIHSRIIERVMRVKNDEVFTIDNQEYLQLNEENVPLINLIERMGETSFSTAEQHRSVAVIKLSDGAAAFEVDEFEETLEIVTKTPGTQLASIAGITGVTVLADSSIALILNPIAFLDGSSAARVQKDTAALPSMAEAETGQRQNLDVYNILRRVLVVDDSLVVRKVMRRDLEGIGFEVETAVDGVDALEVLAQSAVDMALVDLEIPRMNGYELLANLRGNPEYRDLPVIIITSRSGDVHKKRAMDLGADGYITKPYNVEKLEDMMKSAILNKMVKH